MAAPRPIVIIKKKGGHGGHHGGAWKVAYADFVTAMMALFIVLWLMNTSKAIQEAVGGYFRDPNGTASKPASDKPGVSDRFMLAPETLLTPDAMQHLKEGLEKSLKQVPNFDKLKDHIEMTVTSEGLRIDLLEGSNGTFFDSGSPQLSIDGQDLLTKLAQELGGSAQPHLHRRPHRRQALRRRQFLHQLGALRRSRQFRPPHHAAATASAPIRSPRSAVSPTRCCAARNPRSIQPTAASP